MVAYVAVPVVAHFCSTVYYNVQIFISVHFLLIHALILCILGSGLTLSDTSRGKSGLTLSDTSRGKSGLTLSDGGSIR